MKDAKILKPYLGVPIVECGEKMVTLNHPYIILETPHSLQKLGAPYGDATPWMLREGVAKCLYQAADTLKRLKGWRILLTDAYRPIVVQAYMVEHTLKEFAAKYNISANDIENHRDELMPEVLKWWAIPSDDPTTPPPHATGAAIDCTILDDQGQQVPMGGLVDELAEHSMANFYKDTNPTFHANRLFLKDLMEEAGFIRHAYEWWHFSHGDQMWAFIKNGSKAEGEFTAKYGPAKT